MSEDIVVASNAGGTTFEIEHNLGKIPSMFKLWLEDAVDVSKDTLNNAIFEIKPNFSRSIIGYNVYAAGVSRANADTGVYASTTTTYTSQIIEQNAIIIANENSILLGNDFQISNTYQYILRGGNKYAWFAYAEDDT